MNRPGWKTDVQNLKEAFGSLRYQNVNFWENPNADQLTRNINELKILLKEKGDSITSLIFFVLAHGCNDCFTIDGTSISLDDFVTQFDGNNCHEMEKKPKLFFFQPCRSLFY